MKRAVAIHVGTELGGPIVADWTLKPPKEWSMFATHGLEPRSNLLWVSAAYPPSGPVLDEVVIGIDEDANLVWAVAQRLRGRSGPSEADPPAWIDANGQPGFACRPMTRIPPRWHPYLIPEVNGQPRFVQGRAANLSGPTGAPCPKRRVTFSSTLNPMETIRPSNSSPPPYQPKAFERNGARCWPGPRTDPQGLWTQRRRQPMFTPPGMRLRFDVRNLCRRP